MEILAISTLAKTPELADARDKAIAKVQHLNTEVSELRKAVTDAKNELQKAQQELRKLDNPTPPQEIRATPYLWFVVQGENIVWYRMTGGYGEAHPKGGRQYVNRADAVAVAQAAVVDDGDNYLRVDE